MTNGTKSTTKAEREAKVGDRVYWDGDMANPSHVYSVTKIEGFHVWILDECEPSKFGPECDCGSRGNVHAVPHTLLYGPRWGWIDERRAAARLAIEAAARRMRGE